MSEALESIRRGIDKIDARMVKLLRKRSSLVSAAAAHKENETEVRAEERVEEVIRKVRELANEAGLNPRLVENIYRTMIGEFVRQEIGEFKDRQVTEKSQTTCSCYWCTGKDPY